MQPTIPKVVENAMNTVISYAGDLTEWCDIKRELAKILSAEYRGLLSLRNPVTKKQRINNLERSIIIRWQELTDTQITGIPEEVDDGKR